jgi:hypothetical protein
MPAQKALIFDESDGVARCHFPNFLDLEHLNVGQIEIVEINDGTIIPKKTYTGAVEGTIPPTNRIHTINGGMEGSILILRCQAALVIDNTGNLRLRSNFSINSIDDILVLLKTKNGNWLELARSNNG